jgi:hypothetical protein
MGIRIKGWYLCLERGRIKVSFIEGIWEDCSNKMASFVG